MSTVRALGTSVTARRLGGVLVAILLLFGAALAVVLATLNRIAEAEAEVGELDHAKHAGHMAAAMVREQYIHQAHTLINFDVSHLGHYEDVVQKTRAATEHLESLSRTPEEKARATEIARLAAESDRTFRAEVLPVVVRGDRSRIGELGDLTEVIVDKVVELNEELNAAFEKRSADARGQAARLRTQAKTVTLACFALAFVFCGAIGLLVSGTILRPVWALRDGAARVGAGDLGARIAVAGKGEFADLARTFNQMTADLARNQEALLRAQKLASIGQIAAGVAHEINNPLGVILGYVKMMRKEADGEREELRIIEDEAHQCQRIVRGLLDLARPQRLDLADVELAELAREAIARLEEGGQLAAGRASLREGASAVALADEGKVRQVVQNVLLNAAQAVGEGGRIAIDVTAAGDEAVLAIVDDGPGIPADVLPRVFDPFYTTRRGGTGLGLAIAQTIVDAHGGHIDLESKPGQGTRVTLRLPAARRST